VRTSIRSTPLLVSAMCAMVLLVSPLTGAPARAEAECLAAPNAPPPAGQHWWYRTDRATKRKCWYLGPQDKNAAARKADRQERAAPSSSPEADSAAADAAPAQNALPAPAGRGEGKGDGVRPLETAAVSGIPFLVDWSAMLKEAGIVNTDDSALTDWADDDTASTAWALRGGAVSAPAESQVDKDEARRVQAAAGPDHASRARGGAHEAPSHESAVAPAAQIPVAFIAALLLAGGLAPSLVGLIRTRLRRRALHEDAGHSRAPFAGPLPELPQHTDASAFAPRQRGRDGGAPDRAPVSAQDRARAYGGEAEILRILDDVQRRAA
jgi:hypothetical protein